MTDGAGFEGTPAAPAQMMRVTRGQAIATGVVALALALLYLPALIHAVGVWRLDEEFSFAFLTVPIAVGLAWLRRKAIRASLGRGSALGLLGLVGGLLILLAGDRSGIHAIGGASFVLTVLGAAAYLYGLGLARALFFPAAFVTFGLVLYRGLLYTVGFALQNITASYSARAANLVGVHVQRTGVDLFAGQFHFVVAQACSGMDSLLALLCLGLLIVGLAPASPARRLFLLVLILPIVLVANIFRVTLVLTLSQVFGLAVAQGFVHGAFDAVIFLAALGLFAIVGSLLGCYPRIAAMASS